MASVCVHIPPLFIIKKHPVTSFMSWVYFYTDCSTSKVKITIIKKYSDFG